ncbi:MAG: sigma-70 family RNA polymerase sigma factor [Proteobacteria bacterium]|nr:sigma-70 family RNA polymerase sigma factor [Pseudomonadota bacterium]
MTSTEASLVARLQRRDRTAMAETIRTHHSFLVNLVRPVVGKDVAEDLVQEVWIKAFDALDGFEGRARLRTWLAQIALNLARSRRRRVSREVSLEDWGTDPGSPIAERFSERGKWIEPMASWNHETPEELLTEAELRACIGKHVERLPPDQQTVLRLREFECMELAEIAAVTQLSEGNVRVLLHRARQKLHAMIEHFERMGKC